MLSCYNNIVITYNGNDAYKAAPAKMQLDIYKLSQMYKAKLMKFYMNFEDSFQIQINFVLTIYVLMFVSTKLWLEASASNQKMEQSGSVEKVIGGNDCNPRIMEDRVSMVQHVITMKFDSKIHAEAFAESCWEAFCYFRTNTMAYGAIWISHHKNVKVPTEIWFHNSK